MASLLPRWLLRATLICVCILVIAVTVWQAARVVTSVMTVTVAIVAALLLTALLQPLTALLRRVHLPAWLAALLTILAFLAVIGGLVTLLVGRAQAQLDDLRSAVAGGLQSLRNLLLDSPLPLSGSRIDSAQEQITNAVLSALPDASTGANVATEVLSAVLLTIFLWFFLLKEGRTMWEWAMGWVPDHRKAAFASGGEATWAVLTGYVRGTTAVAAIDAVGIGIGMLVLGTPLWASLTMIIFLAAYVPIVGAVVSGALAVGVTLVTQGAPDALILLGVVLLVQQVEGNLLQPLIMGRTLQLHPVAIVVSVTLGALVGGVLGAVVAVPLVAIAYRLALQARERSSAPTGATAADDDADDANDAD